VKNSRFRIHYFIGFGRTILSALLAGLMICPPVATQQPSNPTPIPTPTSDLAAQNLNRVAASPAQIRVVLQKEAGLMLELKRWVAKEATDRGQLLEDAALTDQGIYDRLESDLEFRAIATRLLQRYGYLIPSVNPESDLAKETDLIRQERAQRLAREQARMAQEQDAMLRRTRELPDLGQLEVRPTAPQTGPRQNPNLERQLPQERRESVSTAAIPPNQDLDMRGWPPENLIDGSRLDDAEMRARLMQATVGREGLPTASNPIPNSANNSVDSAYAPGQLGRSASVSETRPLTGEMEPAGLRSVPFRTNSSNVQRVGTSGLGEVTLTRRPNPFADVPSLYEMYRQVSQHPTTIERFGMDIFHNGSRAPDQVPMDLPVGPDYVVGPGDGLAIDLWGSISQRLLRTVDAEGRVNLPEVGPLLVSGHNLGEIQSSLQRILRTQFRDVSADISLSRLRTVRVYVVGDVEAPGAYDISSLSTPLNALFAAGGPMDRGSLRIVQHYRGKQLVQEVDVYSLLLHGVRSDVKRIENGDSILVPPLGAQVRVEGAVRRPAIYELRAEKTLADVLDLAGGILPTATLRKIQVQRVEAHEKRTMLSLDIAETDDREAIAKQLQSFAIRDGDEVRIFPIAPYNQDAIYLEGHVFRPGRYSFRPGMKLTDLVTSYEDILPEPAARYAEIVRLNPPDYRPSVESVDLSAALANPAAAPPLHPMDTVRIFSRYDFENVPIVQVTGEVRQPGLYRTSGQIHVRDAIHLAGGVTPDARLDTAQVFHYLPDSTLKITSVNVQEALAGNPLQNILLQPRDRLLIHKNPAKVDPASVYIKGEVAKPGRYPLTTNMHVSDLISVAGGLKRSAYTETADLTRYLSSDSKQMLGEHKEISIGAALSGDPNDDLPLRDGDTLAIRQIPGWNDIGASVAVGGEVMHPGTYGIKPGERLSSVLKRAGGFLETGYPQGSVLIRSEVRNLQERSKQELIRRIEQETGSFKVALTDTPQEQAALQQAALQQRQRVLESLRATPSTGRLVIRLNGDLAGFENSSFDIELRDGDSLYIPKRPDFVVVTGQVYNANAITFMPRKNAGWYLKRAGGATSLADKKAIFIVRANGEVVSDVGGGWWGGGVLSTRMEPGDTIVVPEKPVGGSTFWKNFLAVAQLIQGGAIAAAVVTRK